MERQTRRLCLAIFLVLAPSPVLAQEEEVTIGLPPQEPEKPYPIESFERAFIDMGDGQAMSYAEWMRRSYGLTSKWAPGLDDAIASGVLMREKKGFSLPSDDFYQVDLGLPANDPFRCHFLIPGIAIPGTFICLGDRRTISAPPFAPSAMDFAGQGEELGVNLRIYRPILSLDPH
ncbi:MAG: hypothetical protein ACOY99_03595 [Pseudomonadota bacterium]